jgi:hypothetical protein
LVFPKDGNQAGVDGFFGETGQPVQLKTLEGSAKGQPSKMVTRANDAYEAAVRNGWSDVAVHIEAPLITKEQALRRWTAPNGQPSPRDMSGGAVASISVHCVDGVIDLPIPGSRPTAPSRKP